jgi:hypothetical protein
VIGELHERFKTVAICVLLSALIGADIAIFFLTLLSKWFSQ